MPERAPPWRRRRRNAKPKFVIDRMNHSDRRDDDEEDELHRNDAEEVALPYELEGAEHAGRAQAALTVTGAPFVRMSAAPRTMLSMPSVAISDGRRP